MNKWPRFALNALGLALSLTGSAYAQLAAVDPGPYTFATGKFPMWYQDNNLLSMELCQSRATSTRAPGAPGAPAYMCILNPEPGVFDDTLPMVFPDNWPPEAFWFLAETSIPQVGNSGYELEVYVAGIEAAFAAENPVDGDQQSFARIRIRASVPRTGTYTITHPYGVETVNVTTAGRRAINITRDIGIGAPGNFRGALGGAIGPWLKGVGGPYTEVNPDTGTTETYIGDPNITEAVTGSPFNTNFVRIEGPAGAIQTNTFTVSGKVLDPRAQTPVTLERATYSRNGSGTRVEVFAKAPKEASLCMRNGLALIGTPPSPCQFNLTADNNGLFFAQRLPTPTGFIVGHFRQCFDLPGQRVTPRLEVVQRGAVLAGEVVQAREPTLGLGQIQQGKAVGSPHGLKHPLNAVPVGIGLDHGPGLGVGRGLAGSRQVVAQSGGVDSDLNRTGHEATANKNKTNQVCQQIGLLQHTPKAEYLPREYPPDHAPKGAFKCFTLARCLLTPRIPPEPFRHWLNLVIHGSFSVFDAHLHRIRLLGRFRDAFDLRFWHSRSRRRDPGHWRRDRRAGPRRCAHHVCRGHGGRAAG